MERRSTKLFSAMVTLAAFAAASAEADAIGRSDTRASGETAPAADARMQLAQNIYPYPGGGGYYYPPGYDPRQQNADGWGYNGRGWGDRFSGGWQSGGGSAYGSGGGNGWGAPSMGGGGYGPPQGGRGNRW